MKVYVNYEDYSDYGGAMFVAANSSNYSRAISNFF